MVRIGGLASGMDIDTLVADLMKAERMPLDKLKQKKQTLEWQRDDYRSMNTLLLNFRTELTQMKLSTNYRARTTSTTNDAYVTASASSAASQSSVSISKVKQLASSERMLNWESVGLDSTKSLNSQTSANPMWKAGAIQTKTITADGTSNPIPIGDVTNTLTDIESWSVKVNGKSFKVVTTGTADLTDSNVYIDTSGNLHFKNPVAKDSTIKLDYITDKKTDKLTLSHNTTTLQLTGGSVRDIDDVISGQQIKLTKEVKVGETLGTPEYEYFNIAQGTDADGNIIYNIVDKDNKSIGTLDKDSGKITLNEDAKGYLPPEQTTGSTTTYNYTFEITYNQNYTNFSIDTETSKGSVHGNFLIAGNETITSVTSKVNSSSIGVSMFYDEYSGNMSLSRTETGKYSTGNDIKITGTLLTDTFKFGKADAGGTLQYNITDGENAEFTINGITTERNSNTFSIDGVSYTLKQTFGDTGTSEPGASPVTINVNNDSQKVYDNIVEFINKYNELIGKIQGKVQEERYRSYTPLTDEQREQLSDKQQEQWEEKAKSGLLRRDPTLTGLLSEMRMDFYGSVDNADINPMYKQLASIGIKTTANYLEGGKLEINEAELKKAIEADPASIEKLFNATGTTEGQKGIVQRLYDTVNASMDKLKEKAGNTFSTNQQFTLGRQLNDIADRIDRFDNRLTQIEDRYWRQFTAMEKAIQQSNQQSMYLMQQFSM